MIGIETLGKPVSVFDKQVRCTEMQRVFLAFLKLFLFNIKEIRCNR